MSTRDEIFHLAVRKRGDRIDRFAKTIMDAETPELARLNLEIAISCLPGVADDPETVPDILRLMDAHYFRLLCEDPQGK